MNLPLRRIGSAALLAAALAASGAAAQTGSGSAPPASHSNHAAAADTGARKDHTDADVRFVQGMISHHQQALEMVSLVPDHTRSPGMQLLARRIQVSQQDEIASMRHWLEDRGIAVEAMDHAHMPGMKMPMMPGMATPEQMARLAQARDDAFDRLFLELMIRHHEGALTMVAELFNAPGAAQEPQLFGMATDVDADQRAEIARMQRMQAAAPSAEPRR
jgi:uncharacterized protein (DUF305 family)